MDMSMNQIIGRYKDSDLRHYKYKHGWMIRKYRVD